jgi:hypothetical protein
LCPASEQPDNRASPNVEKAIRCRKELGQSHWVSAEDCSGESQAGAASRQRGDQKSEQMIVV